MNDWIEILTSAEFLLFFTVTVFVSVLIVRQIKSHSIASEQLTDDEREVFHKLYTIRRERDAMPKTLEGYANSSDRMKRIISIGLPIQFLALLPLLYSLYDRYAFQ
ncbi:hypothetical protein DS901_15945 [Loktanella sp. D2R18]|uniref:hypothetical protein n=1 Tax=Rhodobacterales TaxID=204455 RepID=UPI000DEA8A33|nr:MULTISPECIES: hypothetical protein [Rhodobacterales]MDO6591046.1 hypothetical protein [Yoonia sp. 1_MG-2023]RBW42201.1 hypothetical protein DS901_15945 [Loktanella sp. D2R18]